MVQICLATAPLFMPSPLEPHHSHSFPFQSPALLAFFSPDGSFPFPSVHLCSPPLPTISVSISTPLWAPPFAICGPPLTTIHALLPSSCPLSLCSWAEGLEQAISLQKAPKYIKFTSLSVLLVKLQISSIYLHIRGYLSCLPGWIRLSGWVRQNMAEGS